MKRECELLEIAAALGQSSCFAGDLNCRQEQGD
jgi:hypothetical protein